MSNQADCIFCKIVAGEIPSTAVYRDDAATAFEDANPVAPTHVLVVPNAHVGYLKDADPSIEQLLGHLLMVAEGIAGERGLHEDGHRLVINQGADAGQMVDHLHVHLIGGRRLGALG